MNGSALPQHDLDTMKAGRRNMTVRELAEELWGRYGKQQVDALLAIYEADKRGSVPTMAISFVDDSVEMAEGVKVWHFARVLAGVKLGLNVSIGGGSEIGRGSVIGNYSRIGANCFLPSNSIIGEKVFIGPGVNFADDMTPFVRMEGDPPYLAQPPVVGNGASIGLGALIMPGITIGPDAFVAAGAVVTKDVPAGGSVMGIPAKPFVMSGNRQDLFPTRALG